MTGIQKFTGTSGISGQNTRKVKRKRKKEKCTSNFVTVIQQFVIALIEN